MALVRSEVLDISYDDIGDSLSPAVVLVHGWPDAARGWRDVAGRLAESGWRVLMPDNRGTGTTMFRLPYACRDGSGVALAQDILDLADGLTLNRFAVVGHDWGARAAYTLAALAPERITAMVALALPYQPRGVFAMKRSATPIGRRSR